MCVRANIVVFSHSFINTIYYLELLYFTENSISNLYTAIGNVSRGLVMYIHIYTIIRYIILVTILNTLKL